MKKLNLILVVLLIAVFAMFALGSGESTTNDQGSGSVVNNAQDDGNAAAGEENKEPVTTEPSRSDDQIGDYTLVIDSCRLDKSYDDKPVVIVKYIFSNVSDDDAVSFGMTFDHTVYQNGVGLNEAYFMDDDSDYSADNQSKEIKKGATIEVEVAYELNDTTTDIEVEVAELFSFDDTTITKTFSIA